MAAPAAIWYLVPPEGRMPVRVLFVCLGNICRSPLGEGILRHLADAAGLAGEVEVDSAGTGAWHVGEPPDPRTCDIARRHGIDVRGQRARQVRVDDFSTFDHVVAMDRQNLERLTALAPPEHRHKIRLLRACDPQQGVDVPDPYFGGPGGFGDVFDMVHRCCAALLDEIREELGR